MTGPDPYVQWDAAYVLGALSPAERREFEEHLRGCPECAAAVAELAGLPGVLRSLPDSEALAQQQPSATAADAVIVQLARAAVRRRRRSRVLVGAGAAACLVVGLVLGGLVGGRAAGPAAPSTSAPVAAPATSLRLEPVGDVAVTADLVLQPKAWGTRIDWSCQYPPGAWPSGDGPVYELVVVDADGHATVVASWRARAERAGGLGASSALPTRDIVGVQIRVEGAADPLAEAST